MFDRIGRRDDETPFVVEWFVQNGIQVWSVKEGQQTFNEHVDKLTNYIRYWQASGESIKTSMRCKTRLAQIVQEGRFKGGVAPYGYKLVKNGRLGKKNKELYDLVIDEQEAPVVRLIFEKYVNEGYGSNRISRFLMENGIRNRGGEGFPYTTITGMIKNLTYTGVLRSGEARSDLIPELQIIAPEVFERAREIREKRADKHKHSDVPLNTKGRSLLARRVYCAHCRNILTLTTSGSRVQKVNGETVHYVRYSCFYKQRHHGKCDGPSGYTQTKADGIFEQAMVHFFERIRTSDREQLVRQQVYKEAAVWQATLEAAERRFGEKSDELRSYKEEIKKVIAGKSSFSADVLSELILETRAAVDEAEREMNHAREQLERGESMVQTAVDRHNRIVDWSELWLRSSTEAKKMIVAQLVDKVYIGKDYRMEIDLNVSYEEYAAYWAEDSETASEQPVQPVGNDVSA